MKKIFVIMTVNTVTYILNTVLSVKKIELWLIINVFALKGIFNHPDFPDC